MPPAAMAVRRRTWSRVSWSCPRRPRRGSSGRFAGSRAGAATPPARAMRERLKILEAREKGRAAAREVADGVAETVALARSRGAAFEKPATTRGGRETPYRRQVGLDWLAKKGRITEAQKAAGEAY